MNYNLTHYQGVMEVKQYKDDYEKPKDPDKEYAKRGKVTYLSRKSRRKLFNYILRLENRPGYYFVTLTYPKDYSKDFKEWKKNLHSLYSTLRYHFPEMGFLWKLEFQKRGAPHFHLLMFVPSIPTKELLWKLTRDIWYRVVGYKSKEMRRYSVDVKEIKSIKSSGFYLAMYQAKDGNQPVDIHTGRMWGVYGRKQMPMSEQGTDHLTLAQYHLLKRICRKWVSKSKHSRSYANYMKNPSGSFSIFLPNHEQFRLLDWIGSLALQET